MLKTASCGGECESTYDDSNDANRGSGFGIMDAGSLLRSSVAPHSVLFELLFLMVRV